jgi:hypothetical protein
VFICCCAFAIYSWLKKNDRLDYLFNFIKIVISVSVNKYIFGPTYSFIYIPFIVCVLDIIKLKIRGKHINYTSHLAKFILLCLAIFMFKSIIPVILDWILYNFEKDFAVIYKPIMDIIPSSGLIFSSLSVGKIYNTFQIADLNKEFKRFTELPLDEKIKAWMETNNRINHAPSHPNALNRFIPIILSDLPGLKFLFATTGCDDHLLFNLRFLANSKFSVPQQ